MATGTGNLPNPSISFSPFAILTAEQMNNLVSNINSLATGTGIGDASVNTAAIADGSVTTDKTYVKTIFTFWNSSGTDNASSASFADFGLGTSTVAVPTWATKAIISAGFNGSYQINGSSDTDFRIVFGSVNGRFIRRASQESTNSLDCSWSDEITLSGTGSQVLKIQAKRITGSGNMRVSTDSSFSFVINFFA